MALIPVSCAALAPRIVPVQSARIVQTEAYRQFFTIEGVPRAEEVLLHTFGLKNYEALTAEEWAPYVQSLVDGDVAAIGNGTFILSLLPTNLDQFFVEGTGSYLVMVQASGELLVSGNFDVIDDGPRSLDELRSGTMTLRFRVRVMRHFAPHRPNYLHESDIAVRLHLRAIDEHLVIVDYRSRHEVGIAGPAGLEVIACMELNDTGDERKLLDLRGREFVRSDYADRLARSGPRAATARSHTWIPLRQCPPSAPRGRDCACGQLEGARARR